MLRGFRIVFVSWCIVNVGINGSRYC